MYKTKVTSNFATVSSRGVKNLKDKNIIILMKGKDVSLASVKGKIMQVPNTVFE